MFTIVKQISFTDSFAQSLIRFTVIVRIRVNSTKRVLSHLHKVEPTTGSALCASKCHTKSRLRPPEPPPPPPPPPPHGGTRAFNSLQGLHSWLCSTPIGVFSVCDFVESHGHHSVAGLNELFAKHFPSRGLSLLLRQVQSVTQVPSLPFTRIRTIVARSLFGRTYVKHLWNIIRRDWRRKYIGQVFLISTNRNINDRKWSDQYGPYIPYLGCIYIDLIGSKYQFRWSVNKAWRAIEYLAALILRNG